MKKNLFVLFGLLGVCNVAFASTITIDGNLADWGIDKTNWKPADPSINYTIEDQVGGGSYFLRPGWGGQAYDAEAIYAKISQADQKLYIALATGHNPRTLNQPGANSFGAGDFAIDFGKDGHFDLGINIKHALSVQNGVYTFENFGVEGGVYSNPTWAYGLWTSGGAYTSPSSGAAYNPDPLHPTHLIAGTYRGMANLAYTTTPTTGYGSQPGDRHYFYEMSIDLAVLTRSGWNGQAFDIHWTENCANDSIWVDPPGDVPEPGSLALAALALAGVFGSRRKTGRGGC